MLLRILGYLCQLCFIVGLPIERYSGITTSVPSTNSLASSYSQTSWYLATH